MPTTGLLDAQATSGALGEAHEVLREVFARRLGFEPTLRSECERFREDIRIMVEKPWHGANRSLHIC
jgi:hypothetical protein